MTKTQFKKLKSTVKKALYNEGKVDEWDMMKEIFEEYYFRDYSNWATDKERMRRSIRAFQKMHKILKKCNITGLAEEVIASRHRNEY